MTTDRTLLHHVTGHHPVEHNYDTARRAEIRTFLANHDYLVAHEALSRNEDWFVRRALAHHPAVEC